MTGRLILVTGGAGFIGSNIVARLAQDQANDVVVCDHFRSSELGKWRNLAKHPIADVVRPDALWPWLEGPGRKVELIVHMGAISSTQETDVDKIVETNFALSRDLFAWCARRERRFFYASSAATYGDGARGFDDASDIAALSALRPLNAYGWSKALFDLFVARQAARGEAPRQWAGLKFFNVYGPNEDHKGPMASVASQMWPDVVAGAPVKLFRSYHPDYTDGGQKRDFVYVRDVVDVVAWLDAHEEVGGLYNLGSGEARSFEDLARAVFAAAGREPRIDYVDMPEPLRARYQYFTQSRMQRLRDAGWENPLTSLEDGVADYVGRYLSRKDAYL